MGFSKGKHEARTQMSADRQRRITELCHAALERNASDRAAFLREACAGDEGLRQEVESLLRYEGTGAGKGPAGNLGQVTPQDHR